MKIKRAIEAIEDKGLLLVFPINNRPLPLSLWHMLYPKSEMIWKWDEDGDNRVADHWHLRTTLSESGKVAYAKWYQNRATLFSLPVFTALLSHLSPWEKRDQLSALAQNILENLEQNSPQSTKELNRSFKQAGFEAREIEKAMKELWKRLLIVGYGEVDDGAFPSLAVGATSLLFESNWKEAQRNEAKHSKILKKFLPADSLFLKWLNKAL